MSLSRRAAFGRLLAGGSLALLPARVRSALASARPFTPEMFGARGDGVSNDTLAFARLASAVNANGGGEISFGAGRTYLVGLQARTASATDRYAFRPHEILQFKGCNGPLIIRGNGAVMQCAPSLRYGTFDRSGQPTRHPMPFYTLGELATPYEYMIKVEQCRGPVEISDLELDGQLPGLRIGGEFGDTGRQIPAIGLALLNNDGAETIRNVYTHHHAQDGLYIDGVVRSVPGVVRQVSAVRSEYNGRQGCSIVGGRGYEFRDCKFNHTGMAGIVSAPAAGVDIEAEGEKINRDFRFVNCEFVNNGGAGLLADSGDSEGVEIEGCRFVGSSNWAAWPNKPRMRFIDCTFVGQVVQCHGDAEPDRAAQFHSCRFYDDPKLSPTGKLWASGGANAVADLGAGGVNVLFSKCIFELTHALVLPWSWNAIYSDCHMRQKSPQLAFPKGTYLGTNTISGKVDMYGTKVRGSLVVNGVRL